LLTLYMILALDSGSEHFLIDTHSSSVFIMWVVTIFCVFMIRTISFHSLVIPKRFSLKRIVLTSGRLTTQGEDEPLSPHPFYETRGAGSDRSSGNETSYGELSIRRSKN